MSDGLWKGSLGGKALFGCLELLLKVSIIENQSSVFILTICRILLLFEGEKLVRQHPRAAVVEFGLYWINGNLLNRSLAQRFVKDLGLAQLSSLDQLGC